ncbi:hypothetical protein KAW38_01510 [Candidatus Micrarchaeota archaeon]|nr:hypothetical protein [Candidatus Micrarchaeota archaeon]
MLFWLLLKLTAVLFSLSLIYFAVSPGMGLMGLLKFIALSIGLSMLATILYPHIKGIRKGDKVVLTSPNVPFIFGRDGRAKTNARLNQEIRVEFFDGREALGNVESYEGWFSPPKVKLLYEERLVE